MVCQKPCYQYSVFTNKNKKNFQGEVMIFQMVDFFALCLFWAIKKMLDTWKQNLDICIVIKKNFI